MKRGVLDTLRIAARLLVCVAVLFPIYWMALGAIQPQDRLLSYPPPLLPVGFRTGSFAQLFAEQPILHWLATSAFVAAIAVIVTFVLTVPASYALSTLPWRGRGAFGLAQLVTQMVPGAVVVAPLLALARSLDMTDNLSALALVHAAFVVPICIWVLKGSFDAIPRDLFEAAQVDGCSRLRALPAIAVPLARPGLIAVAVIAFFASWNEYLFASSLVTDRDLFTASLGLATLTTQLDTPLFVLMAASVVFSILPVVFYVTVQRHLVGGFTAGAVKG